MKCRGCGYALWGIAARICPECGEGFKVSERVFVPGNVVFSCAGCGAGYVGRSQDGLPEPSEFACVGCAKPLCLEEMVLRPADGAKGRVEIAPVPWSERRRIGHWRAWTRTIVGAWGSPRMLVFGASRHGSLGEALWFGAWTWMAASLIGLWGIAALIGAGIVVGFATAGLVGPDVALVLGIVTSIGGVLVFALPFWGLLALTGLAAHGVLRATGPTRHGLKGTMDAVGYSSGVALLAGVPCLWMFMIPAALFVQIAFAGVMLCARQRVAWWRGALALAPVVVLSGGLLVGANVAPQWAAIRGMQTGAARLMTSEAESMNFCLDFHHRLHGAPATHGLDLVAPNSTTLESFVMQQLLRTGPGSFPLSPNTGAALRQRWEAQRSAMPADVIAHRVGQYVFTHHGVDRVFGDPDLWTVVSAPIPVSEDVLGTFSAPNTGPFDGRIVAVSRDGRSREIAASDVGAALAAQNALRAKQRLAPLPNPITVLEGQPAVQGGGTSPPPLVSPPSGAGPSP